MVCRSSLNGSKSISKTGDSFEITINASDEIKAKSVIVATGKSEKIECSPAKRGLKTKGGFIAPLATHLCLAEKTWRWQVAEIPGLIRLATCKYANNIYVIESMTR